MTVIVVWQLFSDFLTNALLIGGGVDLRWLSGGVDCWFDLGISTEWNANVRGCCSTSRQASIIHCCSTTRSYRWMIVSPIGCIAVHAVLSCFNSAVVSDQSRGVPECQGR